MERCNNEDIIAYLHALIKYKQSWSWIKPPLPEIGPVCLGQIKKKYSGLKQIAESTIIDFYKQVSIEDLNTLLNYFTPESETTTPINNPTNMEVRVIDNGKITDVYNKMSEIGKHHGSLLKIQDGNRARNIYNHALTTTIDNVTSEHNDLLDTLVEAKTGEKYRLGGKRKSKRRKSKNPTKKGKKNRKSNKKSMKKSMKK
jgi:hypothetical protein